MSTEHYEKFNPEQFIGELTALLKLYRESRGEETEKFATAIRELVNSSENHAEFFSETQKERIFALLKETYDEPILDIPEDRPKKN